MFVDIAKIKITAGDGGNGAVAFRREKYVAAGGPDGGDGGRGGNVVFKVNDNLSTLADFRYKRKYKAPNGAPGQSGHKSGKKGEDLVIEVPRGTIIREQMTGKVMADMSDDDEFVAAKGGRGGWGNSHFKTPTRQTPRFAKPGTPGESWDVSLELKLLADVGLLGFPNVGKSTFISVVSEAKPIIADYHFTTLTPVLGVVSMGEGNSFVMADIPGLIEGASDGIGLGHEFLRHVERCRLLVHILDAAGSEGRDPIEDFDTINNELKMYSEKLSKKPQIVLANKADIPQFDENFEKFKAEMEGRGYTVFKISAATGKGVREVLNYTAEFLSKLPKEEDDEYDFVDIDELKAQEEEMKVEIEDGVYVVTGARVRKIVGSTNFDDYESLQYFQRALIKCGAIKMLENAGIKEGDTVHMYGAEFDFVR